VSGGRSGHHAVSGTFLTGPTYRPTLKSTKHLALILASSVRTHNTHSCEQPFIIRVSYDGRHSAVAALPASTILVLAGPKRAWLTIPPSSTRLPKNWSPQCVSSSDKSAKHKILRLEEPPTKMQREPHQAAVPARPDTNRTQLILFGMQN
jgi:hypothetical protein